MPVGACLKKFISDPKSIGKVSLQASHNCMDLVSILRRQINKVVQVFLSQPLSVVMQITGGKHENSHTSQIKKKKTYKYNTNTGIISRAVFFLQSQKKTDIQTCTYHANNSAIFVCQENYLTLLEPVP